MKNTVGWKNLIFLVEVDMQVQNNSKAIYVYIWGVFLSLDEKAKMSQLKNENFYTANARI